MKKILSLLLSISFLFALCACSAPDEAPALTESTVQAIVSGDFETPKNVILIIGDGMGPHDLILAERHGSDCFPFGLAVNKITNHGLVTTHSANNAVTDSAASATALATGVKTNNGVIGKNPAGEDLKNLSEIARGQGKKVGILTNDTIYGATPSAFSVHNPSRNNATELVEALLDFKPDVLIGSNRAETEKLAGERGFSDFLTAEDFSHFEEALSSDPEKTKPFLGFLDAPSKAPSNQLAQSAKLAFDRLKNEKGFFLLIESAGTDLYGHGNDIRGKMAGVITLDRTVAAAMLFMQENPDTLLIVTSDHETGGVQLPKDNESPSDDLFTTTNHTATSVRIFALGKGSEFFRGKTVDNTDIAKFLIETLTN